MESSKLKNLIYSSVLSGLLGVIGNANAEFIGIKTQPEQYQWIADGLTEYRMDVRADSTDIPAKIIRSAEWDVVVPSYFIVTKASLPDVNNPSQNINDFFYNVLMNSGFNRVDSTISGDELNDNARLRSSGGAVNKNYEQGLLGSYWFTVNTDAPLGQTSFGLNDVYFYDTDSEKYSSYNGKVQVSNEAFEIVSNVPEQDTLTLLASAGVAGAGVLRLKRKKGLEEKI